MTRPTTFWDLENVTNALAWWTESPEYRNPSASISCDSIDLSQMTAYGQVWSLCLCVFTNPNTPDSLCDHVKQSIMPPSWPMLMSRQLCVHSWVLQPAVCTSNGSTGMWTTSRSPTSFPCDRQKWYVWLLVEVVTVQSAISNRSSGAHCCCWSRDLRP